MTPPPKPAAHAGVPHGSATELAHIFELMMQQLALLGHTLPDSAALLTPQKLKVLFTLDFMGTPTPMSKLSSQLGVTPSTLTRVAAGLIRKKYLEKRRSPEDDRVVKLSLTPKGCRMVAEIKRYRRDFFGEVCNSLTPSDCRTLIESHRYIFETYRRILQAKKGVKT
jgi:DNA-binding MarR family transcriptional regulator